MAREQEQKQWEDLLWHQIKCMKFPGFIRQYKFHPSRNYEADFCNPSILLILEVDGGTWMDKGGHTTGTGYEHDRERDLEALMLGYKVMRFVPDMVNDGRAIKYIEKIFKGSK